MENVLTRYRNTTVLVAVLFVQIIGLAVQVKKPTEAGSTSLIRYWVVSAITPLERSAVSTSRGIRYLWSNYLYLRGVRAENRALKDQIDRMRIEEVRLQQDADQARRLQSLLAFKEQFITETVAAQVIGSSGSEQSRILYIDKGSSEGIAPDMAVISPGGIVGKVLRVFGSSSQVLEISDQTSGVGAILDKSRLQGILKGSASGDVTLQYVMSDEKVEPGERIITSGGDRIFPKGLPVGTVISVNPGRDLFLNIRVKPAADLARLEEVLVITKTVEKTVEATEASGPVRAADILAQRLPTVKKQEPPESAKAGAARPSAGAAAPAARPGVPSGVAAGQQAQSATGIAPAAHAVPPAARPATAAPPPASTATTAPPVSQVKPDASTGGAGSQSQAPAGTTPAPKTPAPKTKAAPPPAASSQPPAGSQPPAHEAAPR